MDSDLIWSDLIWFDLSGVLTTWNACVDRFCASHKVAATGVWQKASLGPTTTPRLTNFFNVAPPAWPLRFPLPLRCCIFVRCIFVRCTCARCVTVCCSFCPLYFVSILFSSALWLHPLFFPLCFYPLHARCPPSPPVFIFIRCVSVDTTRRNESFLTGLPLFDTPGSSALTFLRIFMSIPFMMDTERKFGGRKVRQGCEWVVFAYMSPTIRAVGELFLPICRRRFISWLPGINRFWSYS